MSYLNANKKLQLILQLAEKLDIKPYEFGNNTGISTFAARNVLNGKTKKPSGRTVDAMYDYVKQKESGESTENHAQENRPNYSSKLSVEDIVAEKVVQQLFPMLSKLSEYLKELMVRDNARRGELEEIRESLEEIEKILKPTGKT